MSAPPPEQTRAATRIGARSRSSRLRRGLPYALLALVAAALILAFRPRPAPVEVAEAVRGPLRSVVSEEGHTRVRERFVVSAPVNGHLRRTPLEEGSVVTQDVSVVAVLDPLSPAPLDARSRSVAVARRDSAAAQLDKARAAHEFAASELARFERLFRDQVISEQELEDMRWRETAAARDLAAATSALRQAEAELLELDRQGAGTPAPGVSAAAPVEVLSPTTGRVLRVLEEHARVVSAGTPLLEIGDPDRLEVVIEVLSRDGARIRPGALVELDHWGPGPPLEARVRLVEPSAFTKVSALGVEEQRVRVVADLVTPPEERAGLGDRFRVDARIIVREEPDALKIPAGALFHRGDGWAVFVMRDGRAVLRPVRTGEASQTETQILEGLEPGETVILYPGDRVEDGARVRPVQVSSQ